MAKNGRCIAGSDSDCKQATACKKYGYCVLKNGRCQTTERAASSTKTAASSSARSMKATRASATERWRFRSNIPSMFRLPPIDGIQAKTYTSQFGNRTLKATICQLDKRSKPLLRIGGGMPIAGIATDSDDRLYVLEAKVARIRKYRNVAGDGGCQLERVERWGTQGTITLGRKDRRGFEATSLGIDKLGNLYVAYKRTTFATAKFKQRFVKISPW